MKKGRLFLFLWVMGIFVFGCSRETPSSSVSHVKGEYIFRRHDDTLVEVDPMVPLKRPSYPWEEEQHLANSKITKDFFRCKGSGLNPVQLIPKGNEILRFYDCGGAQKHSLPLRNQKEFIYPILIDLLNYLQVKTSKRVVITCGHCCPDHSVYLDPPAGKKMTKHMLGAEVDFYVQGMEQQPEKVIELLLAYYREQAKYKGMKEFEEFQRYEKGDTGVSTLPWYNKEIYIKLYKKGEGRDFDNRHPYPYVSIQVRYDWDLQEPVTYTWDKAFKNFHRW